MRLRAKHLIFLAYFLAIFALRKIGVFSFSWAFLRFSLRDSISWFSGVFLGGYFIKLEQFAYVYYIHPDEILSLDIKRLIQEKRKKEVFWFLRERVSEQRLAFRSSLFQLVWLVLAFFTLTSTTSVFGKALVMAIGLHLLLDEWEDLLKGKSLYWLFWQIKREVTGEEQKRFVWLMTGVFGILSLLLL
ncbi:MAG TPA: hypothetical protein VMW29_03640 [Candidatus Bathyarchaeia archaeon]|nr:hypothetical protein [Candidatus Bathyarchaeia archaeon]